MTGQESLPQPIPHPNNDLPGPRLTSRRHFLRLGAGGLVAGTAAIAGFGALDQADARSLAPGAAGQAHDQPILVLIQLAGGLDFLNTIVPRSNRYQDVRRGGAVAEADLLELDDNFGFNPNLPNLANAWRSRELAIVHGVGLPQNSLSHFVDTDVWTRGREETGDGTGWLGRTLDQLGGRADPLTGISIGDLTPAMYAPGWNAVALPADGNLPWSADFIEANPGVVAAYQQMLAASGRPGSNMSLRDRIRSSQQLVRDVAETVGGATDLERAVAAAELFEAGDEASDGEASDDEDGEAGMLTAQLSLVADLITGGLPTRAYHVSFGDFDTHGNQSDAFPVLLGELDSAIASFRARLGPHGRRVVIATWTEFGRRPDWNGSGTDHGTAGTHLVIGSGVVGGHHGEPVSLTRFDRDDNFLVTTDFGRYLGGLAQSVLGVEAARAVPTADKPMELLR